VIIPVAVEKLAYWQEFLRWGDFPTVFRAVFVYLRSAAWLILEAWILGSEPVVSGSGL
jgi:hypothetical protein